MKDESKLKQALLEEVKKRGLLEQEEKPSGGMKDIISAALHSRTQVHIFHLQTDSQSSFAEHTALGGFYDEIGDLVDGIVESYQGKYDIVKNYETMDIENYSGVDQLISYFKDLNDTVEEKRKGIKESYLQNQIDTVQELIFSTLYKLRFLR